MRQAGHKPGTQKRREKKIMKYENLKFNGIEKASAETTDIWGTGVETEIVYDLDLDEVWTTDILGDNWIVHGPGCIGVCRTVRHMSVAAIKAEIIESLRLMEEYGIKC